MATPDRSDYHKNNPWLLIDGGVVVDRKSTSKACMNAAHKLRCRGPVIIRHETTDRTFHRRGGSWYSDRQLGMPIARRGPRRAR